MPVGLPCLFVWLEESLFANDQGRDGGGGGGGGGGGEPNTVVVACIMLRGWLDETQVVGRDAVEAIRLAHFAGKLNEVVVVWLTSGIKAHPLTDKKTLNEVMLGSCRAPGEPLQLTVNRRPWSVEGRGSR